ncbi:MAG: MFS transporter [Verrucomicrobia bacterium]|nr:MFS transporter [Verrucomicrobiota bacterium]
MSTRSPAFSVLAHHKFRNFLLARFFTTFTMMMMSVAVGWQVYDLTKSPFALGIVGLAQFVPAFLLTLPGGLAADRFDRRRVIIFGVSMELIVALTLLAISLSASPKIGLIFAVLTLIGVGRAFIAPAAQSFLPLLVPQEDFVRAVAWNSSVFQAASIAGPAVGGLLYALGPVYVYGCATACLLTASVLFASVKAPAIVRAKTSTRIADLFTGVKYVFSRQAILGAISLDLFAVLFGGATALLPIYASDILHTGPWGLGLLRSAPAVGAAVIALYLAHHPIREKAGAKLFSGVAVFGLCTIVFGLSRSFALSLGTLVVLGAADMYSVVIRQTLVQISTPDAMRGRVSAVNLLFIGASNELGEFESGVTAAWFGTVSSVVIGGLGTLAVVAVWAWRFPVLRQMDRLDNLNKT